MLPQHVAGNSPSLQLSHRNVPQPEAQRPLSSLMSGARTVQEGRVNMATLATTSTSRLVFLRSRKVTFYTHYPYTLHFLPQSPITIFSAKPAALGSQSAEKEQETIPSFLSSSYDAQNVPKTPNLLPCPSCSHQGHSFHLVYNLKPTDRKLNVATCFQREILR